MDPLQEQKESNSSTSCSTALDVKSSKNVPKRENWDNKIEYLLSSIGYAVGLGNVWRFPYLCYKHGGGAFLFPYIIVLFICGLPIFLLETSIGQFSSQGPTRAFNSIPLVKGIGFAMVNVSLFVAPYYNIILSWTIYYLWNAVKSLFTGKIPWKDCDESWDADKFTCYARDKLKNCTDMYNCVQGNSEICKEITTFNGNYSVTEELFKQECKNWGKRQVPTEIFWENNVHDLLTPDISGINKSEDISHKYDPTPLGHINWHLALTLAISWVVIGFSIIRGVKSSGKTMYVTATLPYAILAFLLARGIVLPGSFDGVKFFITPSFEALKNPTVWKAAITQIFYSLSVCWGGILTLSSYTPFRNDLYRDSYFIVLMNSGTSIFAGFAIFSYLGFMAKSVNMELKDIVADGPGLAFIVWPEAITLVSESTRVCALFGILFFIMLYSLGVSTMIVTVETLCTSIIDIYPRLREIRWKVVVSAISFLFCVGIPLITQNGLYWFQLFDDYCASYSLIMLAVVEMVSMSHIYGLTRIANDIKMMTGKRLPILFKICWPYLTPLVLAVTFVAAMVQFEHTNVKIHGIKFYTSNSTIYFGAFLALCPMILLLAIAIRELVKNEWNFSNAAKPTRHWGPYKDEDRVQYKDEREDGYTYQTHDDLDAIKSLKMHDEMKTTEMKTMNKV